MASTADHAKLLNQLQTEVNRVLEQTGRVFAAATSKDPRANPIGQASKLKQLLPESSNRFHDALDELEEELQFARTVIRRDLALCRHASGVSPPSSAQPSASITNAPAVSSDSNGASQPAKVDGDGDANTDTVMEDKTSPPGPEDAALGASGTDSKPAPSSESKDENASKDQQITSQDESNDSKMATDSNAEKDKAPTNGEAKPETSASAEAEIEAEPTTKPPPTLPDTAISTATDLDSLFGAPTSAGGDGGLTATDNDFTTNAGNDDDDVFNFDFDAAGGTADGNNDTTNTNNDADAGDNSFLAGLQDYAKAADGDENAMDNADLDALFSDLAAGTSGGGGNNGKDGEEGKEANFDDLLDFTDFNADGMGTTGGEGGGDGDFDFDFS